MNVHKTIRRRPRRLLNLLCTFILACNFNKKVTLAQVFSCKFCEISTNTFSYRTPLVAASHIVVKISILDVWRDPDYIADLPNTNMVAS